MSERSWRLMPGTSVGRWSVGLIAVMPILFVIGSSFSRSLYESVPAGRTILADIAERPILALSMLAGMAAGISGLITGLLAIVKQEENALLVYISTVVGVLLTLFLIGELAFPIEDSLARRLPNSVCAA
jgi:thiamine transporter ThiT